MEIVIECISQEKAPMSLLLLADPSERQIHSYLKRSLIYIAKHQENVIGVYVLLETRPKTMEIMNVAVSEEIQGQGIGKQLLQHAIVTAKEKHMYNLEVGTGNSSISQLAFYQKCGFRIFSIDFDYFSKHYEEEMEVHKAITAHSRKQNGIVTTFLQLEAQREAAIEAAVALASNGKHFSVDAINMVTKQINDLAKRGVAPQRKIVTEDMVMEYVGRLQEKEGR